eukprot:365149-Chlamydomonas_euryale.AAC.2
MGRIPYGGGVGMGETADASPSSAERCGGRGDGDAFRARGARARRCCRQARPVATRNMKEAERWFQGGKPVRAYLPMRQTPSARALSERGVQAYRVRPALLLCCPPQQQGRRLHGRTPSQPLAAAAAASAAAHGSVGGEPQRQPPRLRGAHRPSGQSP